MTDAQKAHKYAMGVTWLKNNAEKHRASAIAWYYRNKTKANNASWRYDQSHYQERLEYFRNRHRRINDKTRKKAYKPRLANRNPEYCVNTAHVRSVIAIVTRVDYKRVAALMR